MDQMTQQMPEITVSMVKHLIDSQFSQWSHLPIEPVQKMGNDNRTFRLGAEMAVRLPSAERYVAQVEKEFRWLSMLQSGLTLPISSPIAKGTPDAQYSFPWTVNRYLDGETVTLENSSQPDLATDLSSFLQELQQIDPTDAPIAGAHNFYRGGDLVVYHEETIAALESLKTRLPTERLAKIWQDARASQWKKIPVWIHGDVAPGNLLVANGRLCGVIDFGIMGVGDPACDYAMAWTFFDAESRKLFLANLDADTICRAKGWALWKALITYDTDQNAEKTIDNMLK